MNVGDRVLIVGKHPWCGVTGTLLAFETYGPGGDLIWKGWRVRLDTGFDCYADPANLQLLSDVAS
jgi:hypothetical protein